MKRLFIAASFMAALMCGASLAQSTTPSSTEPSTPQEQPQAQPSMPSQAQPQQQPAPQSAPQTREAPESAPTAGTQAQDIGTPKIAPGSVIPVQLTKSIDAKKVKTGDEVVAKVTQDLKTNSGDVVVPKDTKVVGHVTEAQPRTKEQKESQVGINFDRAVLKGGEVQLPMSIQAIIAPPTNHPGNSGGDQAAPAPGGSTATSPMGGGRSGSMGGGSQAQPTGTTAPTGSTDTQQESSTLPPITGNTQGVVAISNLKLETTAPNAAQGSLLSSEKNNVKIDSGTFMLLRVNQ